MIAGREVAHTRSEQDQARSQVSRGSTLSHIKDALYRAEDWRPSSRLSDIGITEQMRRVLQVYDSNPQGGDSFLLYYTHVHASQ